MHMFVCGQTAECEVTTSVLHFIFLYQNTRRHISDDRQFYTFKCILTVYITVPWIYKLTPLLLQTGRGKLVVMDEVTAVLLLPEYRVNGGSA
jgi:hypothetical protein